ncbi:hypothetical protein HHO41_17925 [Bacillus sp. DNRA2]|uniref:hypothetical protein n=1 Tax=Bacillus sp. DNRA2 TaxID=2723053 RepID=UPI00145C7DE8|nr:hypothetical protein [Bacillus sp. DNRA2]NMD72157.1 hypothetical protein [Bacillus sp. DNRA2]
MRKQTIALSIIACLILLLPNFAFADTNEPVLKMEELAIQVMPEYSFHPEDKAKDKAPLLVGLHGTLINNSDKAQKGQIEIPIPLKSKNFKVGYVADYNREQTNTNEIEYEIDKSKGTISWTTSEEIQPGELYKFVIEYYTNDIKVDKKDHSLTYKFESFADIGLVRVLFLEPLKTESFSLSPAAESHQENGYGMNMFIYQYQGMKPGEVKEYKLKYERNETKTTMDIMNEMGNKMTPKGVEKDNETLPLGVIIGAIVGVCIVIAAVIIFFLKKKNNQKTVKSKQPNRVDKGQADLEQKKKRLRGMLLEGSITEEEYQELLQKLAK